jgi:ribosomal protein S18 acetylase RimI-like enzyme
MNSGQEAAAKAGALVIRLLSIKDCEPIAAAFAAQGWSKPASQYQQYWEETKSGRRVVLVAEVGGDLAREFAGYVTIVWESGYGPFRAAQIPEIVDFNVLIKYRRRGIGTALLDEAERRIAARAPLAGIGVGLTPDYGAAQVLYVQRGYVPDGRGAVSGGAPVHYGQQIVVDDDFGLYLTKRLRES